MPGNTDGRFEREISICSHAALLLLVLPMLDNLCPVHIIETRRWGTLELVVESLGSVTFLYLLA